MTQKGNNKNRKTWEQLTRGERIGGLIGLAFIILVGIVLMGILAPLLDQL